jgi:hypothetical protein
MCSSMFLGVVRSAFIQFPSVKYCEHFECRDVGWPDGTSCLTKGLSARMSSGVEPRGRIAAASPHVAVGLCFEDVSFTRREAAAQNRIIIGPVCCDPLV